MAQLASRWIVTFALLTALSAADGKQEDLRDAEIAFGKALDEAQLIALEHEWSAAHLSHDLDAVRHPFR